MKRNCDSTPGDVSKPGVDEDVLQSLLDRGGRGSDDEHAQDDDGSGDDLEYACADLLSAIKLGDPRKMASALRDCLTLADSPPGGGDAAPPSARSRLPGG